MAHTFMKELFKDLKEDKFLKQNTILNILIILLSFIYVVLYFGNLPPFIPLFNQMPWGEQRIVSSVWIFLPPFLSLLIFGVNLFSSALIYKKNPLIPRLFSITSSLISILIFLFIFRTIHTAF